MDLLLSLLRLTRGKRAKSGGHDCLLVGASLELHPLPHIKFAAQSKATLTAVCPCTDLMCEGHDEPPSSLLLPTRSLLIVHCPVQAHWSHSSLPSDAPSTIWFDALCLAIPLWEHTLIQRQPPWMLLHVVLLFADCSKQGALGCSLEFA